MPRRAVALVWVTGASFVLGCDGPRRTADRPDEPMTAKAIVVSAPERGVPVVEPAAGAAGRGIAGPSAQGTMPGMEPTRDPFLTLFDPPAARIVTLDPVGPAAARRAPPSMNLFGGADQAWRVQVGPRLDLGRKSGLMLRGGTQGQQNRWDLGASATVGDQSNVQGTIRFHP